jgi:hypothetical protein
MLNGAIVHHHSAKSMACNGNVDITEREREGGIKSIY